MIDVPAFLRSMEVFREVGDADLAELARRCREAAFAPGEVVFRENARADRVYLLAEGEVEVWKSHGAEDADAIAVLGPGSIFGEMALVDGLPRSATIVARGPSRALEVAGEDFLRLLRERPGIALSTLRSLSTTVRRSNAAYFEDLKRRNRELEEANRELRGAQEELVRRERLFTLGKLSSLIIHDLRQPLAALTMYADLLALSPALDPRTRENLERMRAETDRLEGMARELLDFSRGGIRLALRTVEVGDFFSRLREALLRRWPGKRIELRVETTFRGPAEFDEQRLVRAVRNLCDNAAKAMGAAGTLEVLGSREGELLAIRVRDTGAGMGPEVLARLFDPFFSSSPEGGTGLGMVIVKNVVEAHGGTVSVESAPGKGTVVTVRLPLRG